MAEERAQNAGCSEIKEIDDDLETNKAGPSKTQEEEQELDSKSMSDRYYEVKYLRFQVDKLRSQVDILKFKIDDLKYGHRSRSRYLWHKIIQLSSQISQLTRAIRFRSRIRSTIQKYRHRQQDGRSNPSLERVLEDEDERPEDQQEQEAPKSGKSEKESETAHQRSLRKGKASLIDFSTSEQHQEEDCMGPPKPPKSIDEILSDQLMLYEEINLLLADVNGLISQALDLSKTTICHEQAPTFPNIVEELNRSGMTNTIEPRSLFWTSLDLADKVNLLRTQVMALDSLVTNPKSPLRTHAGGWISGYFRQRGRLSPTLGRTREAESSSSDAALER